MFTSSARGVCDGNHNLIQIGEIRHSKYIASFWCNHSQFVHVDVTRHTDGDHAVNKQNAMSMYKLNSYRYKTDFWVQCSTVIKRLAYRLRISIVANALVSYWPTSFTLPKSSRAPLSGQVSWVGRETLTRTDTVLNFASIISNHAM